MESIRPSPSKSATLYKLGTIKTGNDGNKWIITENKNGVKKWQKHKVVSNKEKKESGNEKKDSVKEKKDSTKEKKDSVKEKKDSTKEKKDSVKEKKVPFKFTLDMFYNVKILSEKDLEKVILKNDITKNVYKILTTKVIPEINKLKIKTFIVPLPLSDNNIYWDDFPYDYIKETYNEDLLDINHIVFVFYMNTEGTEIAINKNIKINFSEFNKETKIKVIDIFEKYLFGHYIWNGSNNIIMQILFNKNNNIKYIDKSIMKEDDYYPSLYITIDSKINLIENKDTTDKLIKFFEKTCAKYDLLWDMYHKNISFTISSFDDKKIIEKLKTYIKSQTYITKAKFYFTKNKHAKEENIWTYKLTNKK
jgi:hypothetical protein